MTKRQVVRRATAAGLGVACTAAAVARRHPAVAGALAAAGAVAAWAGFAPTSPVFGRAVAAGPSDAPRASLTFDDGPGPSTPAVLDALAAEGVRATFFVLGRQAAAHPELVRRIAAEGHEIANHGYDHGILMFRGPAHVREQLIRTEDAVRAATGAPPAPLFRAPHGFRGPATSRVAGGLGYRTAAWSAGVFDSDRPGTEVIAARACRALHPGAVILLHDADGWDPSQDRDQTAAALPAICADARRRGLELVPFGELVPA